MLGENLSSLLVRARRAAFQISSGLQLLWYRRIWGMDLGQGLKLSRSARLDRTNPTGIHIGDWTAIAFNASVLSHDMQRNRHADTRIGSHCFVGAHAIIMPGVTIGDHCVVGAGSVVMADVPAGSVVSGNPARIVRSNIVTGRWGITDAAFLAGEAAQGRPPAAAPGAAASARPGTARPRLARAALLALARAEQPAFDAAALALPLADCGIDSFGLINLRTAIEAQLGRTIGDADWQALHCLADLLDDGPAVPAAPAPAAQPAPQPAPVMPAPPATAVAPAEAGERRHYLVNQPHMAMRGLAEPWLMKEIGDLHWAALTRDLGTSSSALADSTGARLYATFTRVQWRSTGPLVDFRESEPLTLETTLSRYGAAMFFSALSGRGAVSALEGRVMSSFAKYGEAGVNTSLLKGQPVIPAGARAAVHATMPDFALEYRARRASDPGPALFECDYDLLPPHDINGVGLLYFAAYPTIMELCLMRHAGRGFATDWSLVERDICYFANADPAETLRFRLHALAQSGDALHYTASLARSSDGRLMALSHATKHRVDLPLPGQPLAPRV